MLKIYQDFLVHLSAHMQQKNQKPFLLAIDGRCAAGKTSLAAVLCKTSGAPVIHTDDFYLPLNARGGAYTPAAHMDIARLETEVLKPARAGGRINFRPYDCREDKTLAPVEIETQNAPLIIVEGCYGLHPRLAPYYNYKLFMTAEPAAQQRRVIKRGGPRAWPAFRDIWIPAEELYFSSYNIAARADYIIDTTSLW
ncbi:MAG: uridine kinase [Elusimicrobiota bacterium]|jgi:uridine kinase|nr:uridine kinase [Elusimicrobiota bacterium]